jgi:hypothetical protein
MGGGSQGPCANNYLYFSHNKGSYVYCTEGSVQRLKGVAGRPGSLERPELRRYLPNADAAWKAALRKAAAIDSLRSP